MTTRAAVYLRQSLDKQEGIDRQRKRTAQEVKNRGWELVGEYVDNGISASKPRGPGTDWDRMLTDIQAGKIDVVCAVDMDRLVRMIDDLVTIKLSGVTVLTVDGELDLGTADGELRGTLGAAVARFEAKRKSERQLRANEFRRAGGVLFTGGVRLTGYNQDGSINEEEASLVSRIFADFIAGGTLRGIASKLSEEGVTPRRAPSTRTGSKRTGRNEKLPARRFESWPPSSISSILSNPRYAGRASLAGKATGVTGKWTAIIDDATFDMAQGILSDPRRKTNQAGTARKYIGSGLWECYQCHVPVTSTGQRYWCRAGGHVTRSMAQVDAFVLDVVRDKLGRPNFAKAFTPVDDIAVRRLANEASAVRKRLANFDSDYDAGFIDGRRFAESTAKARAELAHINSERARVSDGSATGDLLASADPVEFFDAAGLERQRSIISEMLTVRLHPSPRGSKIFREETVEIIFRMPQD
ncbi:recombinase family protein [Cryobacterium sp. 10I5]|uniref:recombinase family protein n=1 Tax=Cryobacterium sp. 10I5 TaxID=3048581 RepID=UPI002B23078C|nr:recombinase family protein [Cryobacterium sp. 10I5]MEB0265492.1 recombinase family protein [Cryobacterium sp. 10I5]